jgi:hypothetical protein
MTLMADLRIAPAACRDHDANKNHQQSHQYAHSFFLLSYSLPLPPNTNEVETGLEPSTALRQRRGNRTFCEEEMGTWKSMGPTDPYSTASLSQLQNRNSIITGNGPPRDSEWALSA